MQAELVTQSNESNRKESLLRNTLRGNAAFSILTGLLFVLAKRPLARFIGISPDWALLIVGLTLLPFAYIVYRVATQSSIDIRAAKSIITMDIIWVVASFIFLLLAWNTLTVAGRWFVFLQAEAVATFAVFQTLGVRRLLKSMIGK